jgi:hypothetical protein
LRIILVKLWYRTAPEERGWTENRRYRREARRLRLNLCERQPARWIGQCLYAAWQL